MSTPRVRLATQAVCTKMLIRLPSNIVNTTAVDVLLYNTTNVTVSNHTHFAADTDVDVDADVDDAAAAAIRVVSQYYK